MTNPLVPLGRALASRSVRYVLIGVAGANLYAPSGQASFVTKDFDLFISRIPRISSRHGPRATPRRSTCGLEKSPSIALEMGGSPSASSNDAR